MSGIYRNNKGKSLIALPNDYTVIDIETTGLDYSYCHIIEISAIRVRAGIAVDSFSSLIQPPASECYDENDNPYEEYVDEFITELTGITNEMLSNAPAAPEVMPKFLDFVSDDLLIGHNVSFDVNFIYDTFEALGTVFTNDYIDTMRISRKLLPDLPHHRLKDIAKFYSVPYDGAHRSLADCNITNECYQFMRSSIMSTSGENDFISSFGYHHHKLSAKDISADASSFDETHPIYGKVVVFTGALSSMQRKDAMQLVANFGGINADSVTKKTNFLVIGNEDFIASVKNGKTTKMKKAEGFILKGCDIQILSENAFFDLFEQ